MTHLDSSRAVTITRQRQLGRLFQIETFFSRSQARIWQKMLKSSTRSAIGVITRQMSSANRPYHVPYSLSLVQRAFLVPYFGIGAIADPRRGDLVAGLGDATGERQLLRIKTLLMESSAGRKLIREKPLITTASLKLSSETFPEDSLGQKYAEFMKVIRLVERNPSSTSFP